VVDDLVLKWKTNQDGMHKLSSPWEGPFEVTKVTWPTSYRLAYLDGTVLPNSWHIDKLRRFYPWSTQKERYVPLLYFDYFNKASMFHSTCLFDTIFYQYFIIDHLTDHHSFSSSRSWPRLWLLPTRAWDLLSMFRVVSGRSLVWPVRSYVWIGSMPRSQTTDPARSVRIQ
jgi:hypothetical protein